ncbi:PTS transporter subunit IIC [Psychrobacter lutiphocae]|uniref:PTS transporter subunit IIC n=1 Tax=Psychrobacter lutiphocae TaxID=540500 RepID=UPI000368A603|nr:PTS sugar transporter subunit IIC [Psychrobacter lutiphocae]
MSEKQQLMTPKAFINNVLVGMSIGIVVALIPWALLGNLSEALIPHFAVAEDILAMVTLAMSLLPMVIGVCIGMSFKFTPIQTSSIGIATVVGSGVATLTESGGFLLSGTGDVINAGITAAVASLIVMVLGDRLKAYTILLIPIIVIIAAGGLGLVTLPFIQEITTLLGRFVEQLTTLQPVLMGITIAVLFALIMMSPISTVGIAVAISLAGIGSGAANLGITAAGFGLAIMGWNVNSLGTSFAHILGSPKIQMANFVNKPLIALPVVLNAAILGAFAGLFGISGTPISAGFGFAGFIGPLSAFNTMEGGFSSLHNIIVITLAFFVAPIVLGIGFKLLFTKLIPIVTEKNYEIKFE